MLLARPQRRSRAGACAATGHYPPGPDAGRRRLARVSSDQSGLQAALAAKPGLDPGHPPFVLRMFVVVTEKVQQAVERENAQLGLVRMTGFPRLALGHAGGNNEISEGAGSGVNKRDCFELIGDETQNVGRIVLSPVAAIQGAHAGVADERDTELPPDVARSHAAEPAAQTAVDDAIAAPVSDRDGNAGASRGPAPTRA